MLATKQIDDLNIKTLLCGKELYEIPIYQRNYAWEAKEIEQLIQDITDYAEKHPEKQYYIGTLVVAKKSEPDAPFETVDGQQRFTTLAILSAAIRNNFSEANLDWLSAINLRYASREKSQRTMEAVFGGNIQGEDLDENILSAYKICVKELPVIIKEKNISVEEFASYLYEKVVIMRVQLPPKIDLNHYFEIMNSRGEQLEKHEILKARLMNQFSQLDPVTGNQYEQSFDLIWEACSNMEKYVQYGFTVEQRHILFGQNDWNSLTVNTFDELTAQLSKTFGNGDKGSQLSIDEIISAETLELKEEQADDSPDRFNTVINFPNFLLHVLRIQTRDNNAALDDKRLIDIFEDQLESSPNELEFAKDFIFNLLRCKFLFDKYIIKREFTANTDRWSLKRLNWYPKGNSGWGGYVNTFSNDDSDAQDHENRRVLMLLSMFHVSVPSMVYKHWLNAALNYLFNTSEVVVSHYVAYLEHIAKSFVFDRFLSAAPKDYYEMIFIDLKPIIRDEDAIQWNKTRYGQLENNLLFNFTDYLIWLRDRNNGLDSRIAAFEFTFRSSVEHFYPQQPMNEDIPKIPAGPLHSFGNLCLISHEKNSKFSNYPPDAKKKHYGRSTSLDSLKQFLMMEPGSWGKTQIGTHEEEMKALLSFNRNSDYEQSKSETTAARWFREYKVNNPVSLLQALLGFDDFLSPVGNDKYDFFDFESIRKHIAYELFEGYVAEANPKNLQAVIDYHLNNDDLKADWRYLFIQHPDAIEFCRQGYMIYRESEAHWKIELLKGEKRTKNSTHEFLIYLLQAHLQKSHNISLVPWDYHYYLDISMQNGQYYIVNHGEEGDLFLKLWNKDGLMILCELHNRRAHGNSQMIRKLKDFGWEYYEGKYGLNGKHQICKLTGNALLDRENLVMGFKKLLKKGLAIDL